MAGQLHGKRLVIASHNLGKVREIADLLAPFALEVVSAKDLGLSEPEETGTTYADNAALKALASARASELPALADDSGLSVSALGGRPGLHSARWAGPERDFKLAMPRSNTPSRGSRIAAPPLSARSAWRGPTAGSGISKAGSMAP